MGVGYRSHFKMGFWVEGSEIMVPKRGNASIMAFGECIYRLASEYW